MRSRSLESKQFALASARVALEQSGQRGRNLSCLTPTYTISCVLHSFAPVEDGVAEEPAGH